MGNMKNGAASAICMFFAGILLVKGAYLPVIVFVLIAGMALSEISRPGEAVPFKDLPKGSYVFLGVHRDVALLAHTQSDGSKKYFAAANHPSALSAENCNEPLRITKRGVRFSSNA